MPWDKDGLPDKRILFDDVFHFHREVWKDEVSHDFNEWTSDRKVSFHVHGGHPDGDDVVCLNNTFGRFFRPHDEEKEIEFIHWLQDIMVPCKNCKAGDGKFNPVVHLLLTTLGPGWVGGVLTGEQWT